MDIMVTRNEESFDNMLKETVETSLQKAKSKNKVPNKMKEVIST
jgi:hypothetical protein